jgi:hypothetical protein
MKITTPRIAAALTAFGFSLALNAQPAAPPDAVRRSIEAAENRAVDAGMRGELSAMADLYVDPAAGHAAASRWVSAGRPGFEIRGVEVRGDLAIETGRVGEADYLALWTRPADGSWKIWKDLWGPVAATTRPAVVSPSRAPAATAPPAVVEDSIPIPDSRSLSDGFIRTISDDLKASARRIRAASDPEKRRKAVERADKDLRTTIRDIGWIDVPRFGVPAACDAAFIVSQSGDLPLMRAAVPRIEKDLGNAEGGGDCARSATQAFEALRGR